MRSVGSTLSRLLSIVGLAFVLASAHAFVRVAWMDQRPIALTRQSAAPAPAMPVPTPADPDQSDPVQSDPDPADPADPVPIDPAAPPVTPASDDPLDAPVKPGSLTLREAHDLFEQGAFFLDARYEDDFLAGHIEGAFWMPASRVTTPEGMADLQIIEPGGTVIIYCTGGDCDASENTAIRIENAGFSFDIRILGKGYEDWARAGLPTGEGQP